MDKCPKCGAGEDASEGAFACGTRRGANATVKVSNHCLRRQLAAANERAGRLEEERETLRLAWAAMTDQGNEMYYAGRDTINRILGGA